MNNGAISWMRYWKFVVSLSTTEAKCIESICSCQEAIWLKCLCYDVGFDAGHISIWCDSQSAIYLVKNPNFNTRMKDIDVQYHFICDMVEYQKVKLKKADTQDNVLDTLKKPMRTTKFRWCANSMGLNVLDSD